MLTMNEKTERSLRAQVNFLMQEYRYNRISFPELMKLIDMVYKDYLEFHPEEIDVDDHWSINNGQGKT